MNPHRVFIFTLLLVAAMIKLDAQRIDAAGWFSAVAIAAVLAIAANDSPARHLGSREVRASSRNAPRRLAWGRQNFCVLCGGVSS